MDTPYKWPPGRDYRGYSIRTLFCRVPFGEPHVGSNATASLWQCGVNLRAHGGLKRHQAFEVGGETPEPWWAHTLRATQRNVGGAHGKDSAYQSRAKTGQRAHGSMGAEAPKGLGFRLRRHQPAPHHVTRKVDAKPHLLLASAC